MMDDKNSIIFTSDVEQSSHIPPTVGGTPGKQFCWEILVGRFESPPAHRCTSAAPGPGQRPTFLPEENKLLVLLHWMS